MLTLNKLEEMKTSNWIATPTDKAAVSILIIDNEGYDLDILKSLGYSNVHKKFNHTDMNDYEAYDIILCDINDVAKHIDAKFQGAALAKMIKQHYPNKIVVIYSAIPQSLEINQFSQFVDDIIYKDVGQSMMIAKLDKYVEKVKNPIYFWKASRVTLVREGVSPKQIALLEHYYVKSLVSNKTYTKEINDLGIQISIPNLINMVNSIVSFINMLKD